MKRAWVSAAAGMAVVCYVAATAVAVKRSQRGATAEHATGWRAYKDDNVEVWKKVNGTVKQVIKGSRPDHWTRITFESGQTEYLMKAKRSVPDGLSPCYRVIKEGQAGVLTVSREQGITHCNLSTGDEGCWLECVP